MPAAPEPAPIPLSVGTIWPATGPVAKATLAAVSAAEIDEYLRGVEAPKREALEELRRMILTAGLRSIIEIPSSVESHEADERNARLRSLP